MITNKVNKFAFNFRNSFLKLRDDTDRTLTYRELIFISLYQIKIARNLTRDAWTDIQGLIKACNKSHTPYDLRTTEYLLKRHTGIIHTRYPVCRNNCMCFAEYPDMTSCQYCGETKYDAKGLPHKTFDYLPIIHQLRLRWADATQASQLKSYRYELETSPNPQKVIRDFWDSSWAKKLHQQGIFNNDTDLAFYFSTDGINLFDKGPSHSVWPMILTCFNLDPYYRYQDPNVFCVGIIPGPKKPLDMGSFFSL